MRSKLGHRLASLIVAAWSAAPGIGASTASIIVEDESPPALFAAGEIEDALAARGFRAARGEAGRSEPADDGLRIVLYEQSNDRVTAFLRSAGGRPPAPTTREGYGIRTTGATCWVAGADPAGVLYGGLEVAEVIRIAGPGGIQEVDHQPYLAMRGTKFNIPLDAPALPPRVRQGYRRPQDDLDPAQRRHLPLPLGRARFRPRVPAEHPA